MNTIKKESFSENTRYSWECLLCGEVNEEYDDLEYLVLVS